MKKERVILTLMSVWLITGFTLIALGHTGVGAGVVLGCMLFTWVVGDWAKSKVRA